MRAYTTHTPLNRLIEWVGSIKTAYMCMRAYTTDALVLRRAGVSGDCETGGPAAGPAGRPVMRRERVQERMWH
jgi:hypothetical protein